MELSTALSAQELVTRGGHEWKKDDMHRVYFDAKDLLLKREYAKKTVFNGRELSNTKESAISAALYQSKVWVDMATGLVHTKMVGTNALGRDTQAESLADLAIEAMAEKLAA